MALSRSGLAVYLLVAFAVGSNLTIDQIIAAKDYSLSEAASPALGQFGFYFTVVLAAVATASVVLASLLAVFFDLVRIAPRLARLST